MRAIFIKIHLILGSFFLPLVVLFSITGGLYTFGIKGGYSNRDFYIEKPIDLVIEKLALHKFAQEALAKENLKAPSGELNLKKVSKAWQLEWTGSSADLILEEAIDREGFLKLQYKETNLHRLFVQLHKAKGGVAFKYLAGAFAVALIILMSTGFMMSFASAAHLKISLMSLVSGVVVTFLAIVMS